MGYDVAVMTSLYCDTTIVKQIVLLFLQHMVPFPQISEGRQKGYALLPIYCSASAPEKKVSPATHAYHTHRARHSTGRTAQKNTYEGRKAMPNILVALGADKREIEEVGWGTSKGTFGKHYCPVRLFKCNCLLYCLLPQVFAVAYCPAQLSELSVQAN